jgi:hypothetical protein
MIETIVRAHNTRIVMAIAERLHTVTSASNLPRDREPPLLGIYLIALADAVHGSSDSGSAVRIAGALGKQRRRLGYDPNALSLELELAHSALVGLMTDRTGPALERLASATRACKREALARFAERE